MDQQVGVADVVGFIFLFFTRLFRHYKSCFLVSLGQKVLENSPP